MSRWWADEVPLSVAVSVCDVALVVVCSVPIVLCRRLGREMGPPGHRCLRVWICGGYHVYELVLKVVPLNSQGLFVRVILQ